MTCTINNVANKIIQQYTLHRRGVARTMVSRERGLVVIVPSGVFEEVGTIMLVHVRQCNDIIYNNQPKGG